MTIDLHHRWILDNVNGQQFTWRRKDKTQSSRIDMILLAKYLLSLVQGCKIKPVVIQYTALIIKMWF